MSQNGPSMGHGPESAVKGPNEIMDKEYRYDE
jgi:hypothetical protein